MKLKTLLTEIGWTSDGKSYLLMKTTYPEVYLTRLKRKDGFEGVEKEGSGYKFKFDGEVYDNFEDLLDNRKVQRMMKQTYKELGDRIEDMEKDLKYKDHGAYGQAKKEIENIKKARKRLKKHI